MWRQRPSAPNMVFNLGHRKGDPQGRMTKQNMTRATQRTRGRMCGLETSPAPVSQRYGQCRARHRGHLREGPCGKVENGPRRGATVHPQVSPAGYHPYRPSPRGSRQSPPSWISSPPHLSTNNHWQIGATVPPTFGEDGRSSVGSTRALGRAE